MTTRTRTLHCPGGCGESITATASADPEHVSTAVWLKLLRRARSNRWRRLPIYYFVDPVALAEDPDLYPGTCLVCPQCSNEAISGKAG